MALRGTVRPGGIGARGRRSVGKASEGRGGGLGGTGDPGRLLTSLGGVVYDWDLVTDAITWGANAGAVLGPAEATALATGAAYAAAIEPGSGPARAEVLAEAARSTRDAGTGVAYRAVHNLRLADGRRLCVEDSGRWFAGADGAPAYAHGSLRRRDDHGAAEAGPDRPNDRGHLLHLLHDDLAETARTERATCLLVLCVELRPGPRAEAPPAGTSDGPAEVSASAESVVSAPAETVVAAAAARVRGVMRRRERLVRYAGNRFAITLAGCPLGAVDGTARRFLDAVEGTPLATAAGPVAARLRMGAAAAPEHARDAAGLLRLAEDALAGARRAGLGFAAHDPVRAASASAPSSTSAGRARTDRDVLDALNARRVDLARQPVFAARRSGEAPGDGNAAFHEALARLRLADGTVLRAGEVVPVAERAGLAPLLDARVLELATAHLVAHPAERLAINVGAQTLEAPDWLATLAAHLGARPGVAPRLIVEVAEGIVGAGTGSGAPGSGIGGSGVAGPLRAKLDAMKALGVALAVDRFGAGGASLARLREVPVDILKIDGALVQNLRRSAQDRALVRALVDFAHGLAVATVATWVEDEETATMLAEWGVDYLEGEYLGAPVAPSLAPPASPAAARTG